MPDLMEMVRVQRHDFLNHLQVISGLLQLGKTDRAREYITKVVEELQKEAAISKTNLKEDR